MGIFQRILDNKEALLEKYLHIQIGSHEDERPGRHFDNYNEDNDYKIISKSKTFVELLVPDVILGGEYPFENKQYYSYVTRTFHNETGQLFKEDITYFADSDAIRKIAGTVYYLETIINSGYFNIRNLPEFHTDFNNLTIFDNSQEVPSRTAYLVTSPLTPTGKPAKFPAKVSFNACVQTSIRKRYGHEYVHETASNGTIGHLYYLQDGQVGKTELNYWKNHIHYLVAFKIVSGELTPSLLEYDDASGIRQELYRLQ